MTTADPACPEPRLADTEGEPAPEDEDEISWLLAAALIETRRQGDPLPRNEVMGLLAEMTVERGPGTVTQAALGLTDIAGTLLEVCAHALGKAPESVLRDVLVILRDGR
jgi:hypothetical protein